MAPESRHPPDTPAADEGKVVKGVRIEGGRIKHGPHLAQSLRAEVNRCRKAAPGFASVRNRVDTAEDERRLEALPHGFMIPAQRTNPRTKRGRGMRSLVKSRLHSKWRATSPASPSAAASKDGSSSEILKCYGVSSEPPSCRVSRAAFWRWRRGVSGRSESIER